MSIRARIFSVVGVVIAAAFLQTLIVLRVEDRRATAAAALDRSIWRLENQADLGRLIVELDASESDRLWGLYERTVALMLNVLDSPESKRELAAVDALMRGWRAAPPGDGRAAMMARIRSEFDRFVTRERGRLGEERVRVNSQSLQSTLLTLGVPAVAIVMLLLLVAFVARILLDPLAAIANSARQISGGSFDVTLAESKDETAISACVPRNDHRRPAPRARGDRGQEQGRARARAPQGDIGTVPVALVILDAETCRIVVRDLPPARSSIEPDDDAGREAYRNAFRVTTARARPWTCGVGRRARARGETSSARNCRAAPGMPESPCSSARRRSEEDGRITAVWRRSRTSRAFTKSTA